jgi:metallo-beta-lactamase class B
VFTPGHTPNGTSWTWQSCALNTCYDVVYADSLSSVSAPGFGFASSGAANDIITSAGIIGDLDCDIFLSPHPFFFGMQDKLEREEPGNPFVNNLACLLYAESMIGWLEQRLDAER